MAQDKHVHDYREVSRVTNVRPGKGWRTTVTLQCSCGMTRTVNE